MTEVKTYQMSGVKITVELENNLKFSEHCPSDNDLVVFVQDRLTLHMHRVGEITNE